MPYKNPKELLTDATKLPAAIEGRLPEAAPKISTRLVDAIGKLPDLPDFFMELPDLPEVPELPEMPGPEGLRRARVEVKPLTKREVIPSPAVGVIPEVITRRGM